MPISCPLCQFEAEDASGLELHIEALHPGISLSRSSQSPPRKAARRRRKRVANRDQGEAESLESYLEVLIQEPEAASSSSAGARTSGKGLSSFSDLQDEALFGRRIKEKCDFCEKTFPDRGKLMRHLDEAHEGHDVFFRTFKCDICDMTFLKRESLEKHMKKADNHDRKCKLCNTSFANRFILKRHYEEAHGGKRQLRKKPFCEICHKSFFCRSTLNRHVKTIHKNREGKEGFEAKKCKVCGKTFPRRADLKRHQKLTQCQRWVFKDGKCEICDEVLADKKHFKKHMNEVHKVPRNVLGVRCQVCDKSFLFKSALLKHTKAAHGDGSNDGVNGEQMTEEVQVQQQPKKVRKKQKGFLCELCDKSFSFKQVLDRHVKEVHEGHKRVRPNYAPDDNFGYDDEDLMDNVDDGDNFDFADDDLDPDGHLFEDNPQMQDELKCEPCNKFFVQRKSLLRHIREIHGGQRRVKLQYQCEICQRIVLGKDTLNRHMRNTHKMEPTESIPIEGKA